MPDLATLLAEAMKLPPGLGPGHRTRGVVEIVVDAVKEACRAGNHEVALLALREKGSLFVFLYPFELGEGVNQFPMSAPSIAGQVVKSGRGAIFNRAHDVPHLSFYERVRIKDTPVTEIRKLLAAPVRNAGAPPVGVIEVSRRSAKSAEVGPDFTQGDLAAVEQIATVAATALAQLLAGG